MDILLRKGSQGMMGKNSGGETELDWNKEILMNLPPLWTIGGMIQRDSLKRGMKCISGLGS